MSKEVKRLIIIISILVIACFAFINQSTLGNSKENSKEDKSEVLLNNKLEEVKEDEHDLERKNAIESEIQKLENILNDPMIILINKKNSLSSDYEPPNLKTTEIPFLSHIETRDLEAVAADAVKEMFDAARKEGINLLGASGYRSYNIQTNLYNSNVKRLGKEKADLYSAAPGTSEHQLGLAIDIVSEEYNRLEEEFENTEAFNWLMNNCHKYGFILRYKKGKENITEYNYEPWHYRYIGNVEVAEEIMSRDIVLEEYINELNNKLQDLNRELERIEKEYENK